MISFIKRFWKWIIIGAALACFAMIGLEAVRAMIMRAAFAQKKAEYNDEIAARDSEIAAKIRRCWPWLKHQAGIANRSGIGLLPKNSGLKMSSRS